MWTLKCAYNPKSWLSTHAYSVSKVNGVYEFNKVDGCIVCTFNLVSDSDYDWSY